MEKITLQVQGMTCGHCVKAVENSVGELEGVKGVNVDLKNAKVDVEFEAGKVTVDTIKETIDDQGYDVQ